MKHWKQMVWCRDRVYRECRVEQHSNPHGPAYLVIALDSGRVWTSVDHPDKWTELQGYESPMEDIEDDTTN